MHIRLNQLLACALEASFFYFVCFVHYQTPAVCFVLYQTLAVFVGLYQTYSVTRMQSGKRNALCHGLQPVSFSGVLCLFLKEKKKKKTLSLSTAGLPPLLSAVANQPPNRQVTVKFCEACKVGSTRNQ